MKHSSFYLVCLPLLGSLTVALPGGCPGDLNIISTNSSRVPLLWTCSPVNTSPMFGSGQNALIATYMTSSDVQCADSCAPWYAMAAFWYPNTNDCECWEIGDITGTVDYEENGATWIDFYWDPPPPAHDWGVFTCPEGSYCGSAEGFFGFCESVNVFPAGPPLSIPCIECKYYGQYYVQGPDGYCECYDDIAGLKVSYNYSSPYILYDMWDFTTTAVTSTTTHSSSTSTTMSNSFTTSSKLSSKPTSSTKPTVTSTSKASSKKSSSTKANVTSTKATSSTKAAVTSTGKSSSKATSSNAKRTSTKKPQPSTTSSTRTSSKPSTHASTATK